MVEGNHYRLLKHNFTLVLAWYCHVDSWCYIFFLTFVCKAPKKLHHFLNIACNVKCIEKTEMTKISELGHIEVGRYSSGILPLLKQYCFDDL